MKHKIFINRKNFIANDKGGGNRPIIVAILEDGTRLEGNHLYIDGPSQVVTEKTGTFNTDTATNGVVRAWIETDAPLMMSDHWRE